MAFVAALQIADEAHGAIGDGPHVVGRGFGHAGDGEIGVADGLDPLAAELFCNSVEGGEDIVQLAERDRGVVFRREAGEVDEV